MERSKNLESLVRTQLPYSQMSHLSITPAFFCRLIFIIEIRICDNISCKDFSLKLISEIDVLFPVEERVISEI